MSGAKHTPGPWKIVTGNSDREFNEASIRPVKSPFKGIVLPIASVRYPHAAFGLANAALIAAAPDLLAALKIVRGKHGCGALVLPDADLERVDAAIAKATRGAA